MEEIKLLNDLLDDYDNGLLELNGSARKYYLTEQHKAKGSLSWIHDDEIPGQSLLRKMSKSYMGRDVIRKPEGK